MLNYLNGKGFMYENVTHPKLISKDSIINESINIPRRSMKGLLFLPYAPEGARDSEKTFSPDITQVRLVPVNGINPE